MDVLISLLAGYVLAGAIWPRIVRNPQFYAIGAALVIVAISLSWIPIVSPLVNAATFAILVLAALERSPREFWEQMRFW